LRSDRGFRSTKRRPEPAPPPEGPDPEPGPRRQRIKGAYLKEYSHVVKDIDEVSELVAEIEADGKGKVISSPRVMTANQTYDEGSSPAGPGKTNAAAPGSATAGVAFPVNPPRALMTSTSTPWNPGTSDWGPPGSSDRRLKIDLISIRP